MNVFVCDNDPTRAALQLCDKHVVKMIVESVQILSSVDDKWNLSEHMPGVDLCRPGWKNHPAVLCARNNSAYALWIAEHGYALSMEYACRYGKIHAMDNLAYYFRKAARLQFGTVAFDADITNTFPRCMPEKYALKATTVDAYRSYLDFKYNELWAPGKARWTNASQPSWCFHS